MAKEINSLPYNLEAEQSLLCSILIDRDMQYEIRAKLKTEDFYVESHKLIFEGICSVLDGNKPVDVITLTDEMSKTPTTNQKRRVDVATLAKEMEIKTTLQNAGGIDYLIELTTVIPSSANYEYYLEIVKRDSTMRKLIKGAGDIIADATYSTDSRSSIAKAEKIIYDISEQLETSSLTQAKENTMEVVEYFANIQNDKNFMQGMNTGFTMFDKLTRGLHRGNLVIVAARPSVGKTTFVMNVVEHVALKSDAVCAVFALEMTKKELVERMMYSISGVSSENIRQGVMSNEEWHAVWDAQKLIDSTDIYIDDTSMTTVPDILSKCRRLKNIKGKLDLIVVDHIQLMNAVKPNDSRQAEITEISRGLKMIAKELDVPVIALSQLNRSVEKVGRKPILSDLRESGAIEQDADIVMFIHRPEMTPEGKSEDGQVQKKGETEIILAKNRSGALGNFNVLFKGEQSKFVNISYNVEPQGYQQNGQNSQNTEEKEGEDDVF